MKFTILGAGMMGSAVAYDLALNHPGDEIVLADIDFAVASRSARAISPSVKPLQLDIHDAADLLNAMEGSSAVVSAVSYSVNYSVAAAALQAHVHMVDMGGNNDIVRQQRSLDDAARSAGITIVPNAGLAPGLINVLAMAGVRELNDVKDIRLRVGGLPQHPRPPLNYQITFSVEGLINEYVEKALVIRGGRISEVESMADLEDIEFPPPFGTLEAFNTSGGLSLLPELMSGKVDTLEYKTIRYKGHCEKMKTLLDLGFASNDPLMIGGSVRTTREFFTDLLSKKLDFHDKDVVLARATITGQQRGVPTMVAYEFIDYYDDHTRMSAMMRTTAFPVAIIARMLANGTITQRGVLPPEVCVPAQHMIDELAKRNITITKSITETSR
jgi:lysine 6-dehydrogenase